MNSAETIVEYSELVIQVVRRWQVLNLRPYRTLASIRLDQIVNRKKVRQDARRAVGTGEESAVVP